MRCTLLVLFAALASCVQQPGSLGVVALQETLASKHFTLSNEPAPWLTSSPVRLPQKAEQQVFQLLRQGKSIDVGDSYYEEEEEASDHVCYLQFSNGQSLVARLDDGLLSVDDMQLAEPIQKQLYSILLPYIKKLND